MADVLGVGISIASLTIQIVENLNKTISFYKSIRDAPTDILRIIIELQILSNIISAIKLIHEKPRGISEVTTKKCLALVRSDINKLSCLSLSLERKLNSGKIVIRAWACVQTVLSENKITKLKSHLKSAMEGLQMLQNCHIFAELQALNSLPFQKPKDLGHCWETGLLEDHVKIDDGLEKPFYLPLDLCSTPKIFMSILSHKYTSRNLPGLPLIQQGHVGVWDWSESIIVNSNNWELVVKGGRGIKLAFIMSTWHGFQRNKCIRCFKPRGSNPPGREYNKCSSCGLEVHRVDPDDIPFEATDVTLGHSPNQYRDYLLGTRKKKINQDARSTLDQGTTPLSTSGITNGNPPIDFACRRLIIKWEPLFNVVHRYLYCRCVIRLSTPSHIEKEMTIIVPAPCPRHNTVDACHTDYGEINYYQDPYFEQFGGYYSFQYFIYLFKPNIYDLLGGERFLRNDRIEDALKAFNKFREGNDEGLSKMNYEYFFEINNELEKVGFKLPDGIVENIRDERLRRRNESKLLGHGDFSNVSLSEEERQDFSDMPMVREVKKILAGKWSGKPHWAIENWG